MYHHPVVPIRKEQQDREMAMHQTRSLEDVLKEDKLPIGSNLKHLSPSRNGVVKIENIPYTVTRTEVEHLFGRGAALAKDWPIHIIMERSTGKTMDCYVEFDSRPAAQEAVIRTNHLLELGQAPRMGTRHLEVTICGQDDLMHAVFPLTKCLKWVDGRPFQMSKRPDEGWSTGFTGFVTDEEMYSLVRHAEQPQRSVFATKVPQRTYESMLSLLWKYPWFATHLYTVQERNKVFCALRFMIEAIVSRIKLDRVVGLDRRLVDQLVMAGLKCPAFNPRMKFCLAYAGEDDRVLRRMDEDWLSYFPFDTLTWLSPYDPVALKFYATLLSRGYVADHEQKGLMQRWNKESMLELYGRFWLEWEDSMVPPDFTLADCIDFEKNILRGMLCSGYNNLKIEQKAEKDRNERTEKPAPKSGSPTPTVQSLASQVSRSPSVVSAVWRPARLIRPLAAANLDAHAPRFHTSLAPTRAQAPRNQPSRDQDSRAPTPRNQAPRNQGPRNQGPRNQGPRNQGPRNQGPRNQASRAPTPQAPTPRNQAPRNQTPRNQTPRNQGPCNQPSLAPTPRAPARQPRRPAGVLDQNFVFPARHDLSRSTMLPVTSPAFNPYSPTYATQPWPRMDQTQAPENAFATGQHQTPNIFGDGYYPSNRGNGGSQHQRQNSSWGQGSIWGSFYQ